MLRWLDGVFRSQYLPILSVNYIAINKDLDKLPPQLYWIKTKICFDQGYYDIFFDDTCYRLSILFCFSQWLACGRRQRATRRRELVCKHLFKYLSPPTTPLSSSFDVGFQNWRIMGYTRSYNRIPKWGIEKNAYRLHFSFSSQPPTGWLRAVSLFLQIYWRLQSRARSFSCRARFAWRTKKKERLLGVYPTAFRATFLTPLSLLFWSLVQAITWFMS